MTTYKYLHLKDISTSTHPKTHIWPDHSIIKIQEAQHLAAPKTTEKVSAQWIITV